MVPFGNVSMCTKIQILSYKSLFESCSFKRLLDASDSLGSFANDTRGMGDLHWLLIVWDSHEASSGYRVWELKVMKTFLSVNIFT